MSRTLVLSVLTLTLAGGAAALPPAAHAAATSTRSTSHEQGADALLSDYPADGHVVAGRSYHDTLVSAEAGATGEDGGTSRGAFALFATTSYSFDAHGSYVEGAQTSGYADGAVVQLSVDRSLGSAHLRATVPATMCDRGTCTDLPPVQLSVDWTGTGHALRTSARQRTHLGATTVVSTTRGTSRSASAVTTSFGRTSTASLWRGTSRQSSVTRG